MLILILILILALSHVCHINTTVVHTADTGASFDLYPSLLDHIDVYFTESSSKRCVRT